MRGYSCSQFAYYRLAIQQEYWSNGRDLDWVTKIESDLRHAVFFHTTLLLKHSDNHEPVKMLGSPKVDWKDAGALIK